MMLSDVITQTNKLAKTNAELLSKHFGINTEIFSIYPFTYSIMPIIRGNDLSAYCASKKDMVIQTTFMFIIDEVRNELKKPEQNLEDLQEKWGPFLYKYTRMLLEIIYAVNSFHKQRLLHRDIKPDNFMLTDNGTIQLIDLDHVVDLEYIQNIKPKPTETESKQHKIMMRYYLIDDISEEKRPPLDNIKTNPVNYGTLEYQSPEIGLYDRQYRDTEQASQYVYTVNEDLFSLGKVLEKLMHKDQDLRKHRKKVM